MAEVCTRRPEVERRDPLIVRVEGRGLQWGTIHQTPKIVREGALLIRRSRGLHLTSAGELFLRQARLQVANAETAERMTRLALHEEAGILRVGFGVAVLARGLPDVILRFRRRFPEVNLSVENMSTADQLQALSDRTSTLGGPSSAGDRATSHRAFIGANPQISV